VLNSTRPIMIVHEGQNRLTRHRWVFELESSRLVLVRYHYEIRRKIESPWGLRKFYEANPTGAYGDWEWLKIDDVPWPSELEQEAKEKILEGLVVLRQVA